MRYYKEISEGFIVSIGTGNGFSEITADEYSEIKAVIAAKPPVTDTTDYLLREDLTWEEITVDPPDPDPELDDSEALSILLGGVV